MYALNELQRERASACCDCDGCCDGAADAAESNAKAGSAVVDVVADVDEAAEEAVSCGDIGGKGDNSGSARW